MDTSTPIGSKRGASMIRDIHKRLMALRPMRSSGTILRATSQGVNRRATPGTGTGGSTVARWA